MRSILLLALILAACSSGGSAPAPPPSPCRHEKFENSGFIVCQAKSATKLKLFAAGREEKPRRHFNELGLTEGQVAFAMNAGMYGLDGRPIGLAIVDGKPVHAISLRASSGNFGMKPNGVFLVRKGKADIVTSEAFKATDVSLATQSGPMLVIGGKMHPKFDHDGESQNMRNGVGIGPNGAALFVMTEDPVSLGKLARFFRDELKTRDALYFDGSVSSLWSPSDGRMDDFTNLGPIIVALN